MEEFQPIEKSLYPLLFLIVEYTFYINLELQTNQWIGQIMKGLINNQSSNFDIVLSIAIYLFASFCLTKTLEAVHLEVHITHNTCLNF